MPAGDACRPNQVARNDRKRKHTCPHSRCFGLPKSPGQPPDDSNSTPSQAEVLTDSQPLSLFEFVAAAAAAAAAALLRYIVVYCRLCDIEEKLFGGYHTPNVSPKSLPQTVIACQHRPSYPPPSSHMYHSLPFAGLLPHFPTPTYLPPPLSLSL
jgi:hypothetical protein